MQYGNDCVTFPDTWNVRDSFFFIALQLKPACFISPFPAAGLFTPITKKAMEKITVSGMSNFITCFDFKIKNQYPLVIIPIKDIFLFCFSPERIGVCHKKRNKKGDPAKITAIAGKALIKLLYYCKLKFSSLIFNGSKFVSFFQLHYTLLYKLAKIYFPRYFLIAN